MSAAAQPDGENEAPEPASDDAGEVNAPVSAADEFRPAGSLELRFTIADLIADGNLEAAEALADLLLELTAADFGPESSELAEAHLLIGEIHKQLGNFTAAETSILNAIDIYEAQAGPLSPLLIDPFMDLGENYEEGGDYASAISAYSEARTIGRRTYGLLNEDQIAIIDDMTRAAEALGQLEEARELQLEALTLVERNYDQASLEAIEARYKFADWLREHRQYDEERRIYFEIQRIISRAFDDDPLMTVRVLRERAASYRQQDHNDGLGLAGLRDAVEILEAMPDPPPLLLAQVYLEIGDWNVEFSRTGAIGNDYVIAWSQLGNLENANEIRDEWFGGLTVVDIDPVSRRDLSSDPDAPLGYVEIYFTVDRSGRTRDIEITASEPVGLKDSAFIRQYREARFRPRVENGELVEVRRARRNEFRYDPAALQSSSR